MDLSTLDVWDQHLARVGAELLAQRLDLVAALQPLADKAYEQLAPGGGPVALEYKPSSRRVDRRTTREELYEQLMAALAEARKQEIERGVTLVGPHRDDLLLKLGQLPAKGYASATASPGRTRWRCGWPRTTCCGPRATSRCWSSTTSSPSWTPVAGSGWPSWSRPASRCW